MTKTNLTRRFVAIAAGAPIAAVGLAGLSLAPAQAAGEGGATEDSGPVEPDANVDVRDFSVGTLVSLDGVTGIYESPDASANVLSEVPEGQPMFVEQWATSDNPWHSVIVDPFENPDQVGYVSVDAAEVDDDFNNTYDPSAEGGSEGGSEGNAGGESEWDVEGDDGAGADSGETGSEGQNGAETGAEGPNGAETGAEGPNGAETGPGGPEANIEDTNEEDGGLVEEDGFVEEDEESGDPTQINSGFIGGDNSSPAGLAFLGAGGLALVGGGTYALMRRKESAEATDRS